MRCFIAIPCPDDICLKLSEIQNRIKNFGGMKLVERENIHMTLKFLGEVDEEKTKKISDELGFLNERKRFEVKVRGLGAFPKLSHVNVIWAGVEDGGHTKNLQNEIDEKTGKLGFSKEENFHPHYTIARVKYLNDNESIGKFITEKEGFEFGRYTVESIKLMASQLNQKGSVYSTLVDYRLV